MKLCNLTIYTNVYCIIYLIYAPFLCKKTIGYLCNRQALWQKSEPYKLDDRILFADVGQVTVDWLGGNVYWADEGFRWIVMKPLPGQNNQIFSLDPNFRIVVDKYLDKPRGLTAYPQKK